MNVPQEQLDQENQHPLNQKAKQLLRKADQKPDPSHLFLLQLLLWVLETRQVRLAHNLGDLVRDSLDLLVDRPPDQAMRWLLQGPPDQENSDNQEEQLNQDQLLQEESPAAFAEVFLQLLQNNLQPFLPMNAA